MPLERLTQRSLASWPLECPDEVTEVGLLLTGQQLEALDAAATSNRMTIGTFLRMVIRKQLAAHTEHSSADVIIERPSNEQCPNCGSSRPHSQVRPT